MLQYSLERVAAERLIINFLKLIRQQSDNQILPLLDQTEALIDDVKKVDSERAA